MADYTVTLAVDAPLAYQQKLLVDSILIVDHNDYQPQERRELEGLSNMLGGILDQCERQGWQHPMVRRGRR